MTKRFLSIVTAVTVAIGVLVAGVPQSEAAVPSRVAASTGSAATKLTLFYVQRSSARRHLDGNSSVDPFLNCPGGYKAVGGGAFLASNNVDQFLSLSEPSAGDGAWVVNIINNSSAGTG